jgi:hypothetical protein
MRHQGRPHCQISARFFFFEKKKQKTFAVFGACWLTTARPTTQSLFASFSSEKEDSSDAVKRNTMSGQFMRRLTASCSNPRRA